MFTTGYEISWVNQKSMHDAHTDTYTECECDCEIAIAPNAQHSNGKHQMKAKRIADRAENTKMPYKYAYDAWRLCSFLFIQLKPTAPIQLNTRAGE